MRRFLLLIASIIYTSNLTIALSTAPRPIHVQSALQSNSNLYYLGIASNMLRSKLMNRGLNNTKIDIINIKPATVGNYRLAFNSRGFLPLEPAMGSLEPSRGKVCHAALIEMTAAEYEKLWLSEGGGRPEPGYEEIIVDAYPYGSNQPVKAVALRASVSNRLSKDADPSKRYLDIIIDGAKETGLDASYIKALSEIRTHKMSIVTKMLATFYSLFVFLLFQAKMKSLYSLLSKLLWAVYVPASSNPILRLISELFTIAIILPASILGVFAKLFYNITGKKPPTMFGSATSKKAELTTARS